MVKFKSREIFESPLEFLLLLCRRLSKSVEGLISFMKERVVVEEEEEDDDPLELFSSSLATLFSIFTPSLGSPSSLFTYTPPASSSSSSSRLQSITVRIPPQIKNELFTHYQWMSGIKLADRIVLGEIEVRGKKVLELGAGTGLPGLMAGKLGANEVRCFLLHS